MKYALVDQHTRDGQLLGQRGSPPRPRLGLGHLGLPHGLTDQRKLLRRRLFATAAPCPFSLLTPAFLPNPTDTDARPRSVRLRITHARRALPPWTARPYRSRTGSRIRTCEGDTPEVPAPVAPGRVVGLPRSIRPRLVPSFTARRSTLHRSIRGLRTGRSPAYEDATLVRQPFAYPIRAAAAPGARHGGARHPEGMPGSETERQAVTAPQPSAARPPGPSAPT